MWIGGDELPDRVPNAVTRFPQGPGASPGFLLWRVTLRWQRAMTAALAPLDITHVQLVILACTWWLTERGDAPNQLAVAAQAGTDPQMTSQVVRRLEAKGLLERHVDPRDSRGRTVVPTRRGIALARKAIAAVEDADETFFAAAMSPALLRTLTQLARQPG